MEYLIKISHICSECNLQSSTLLITKFNFKYNEDGFPVINPDANFINYVQKNFETICEYIKKSLKKT